VEQGRVFKGKPRPYPEGAIRFQWPQQSYNACGWRL